MEFQQLRCFREVAATQSYSTAAESIGISRTAVRQNIKELESSLSTTLFIAEDPQNSYRLTEHGKILLQYASRILSLQERMVQDIEMAKHGARQVVRVLYNDNLLHTIMPRVSLRYAQTREGQKVEFDFNMRHHLEGMETMLREDQADLAFSQSPKVLNSELNYIAVAQDQLYVLLPKDHPLAYRRRIRLQELANEPLIMPDLSSISQNFGSHESMLDHMIKNMFEVEHVTPFVSSLAANMPERIAYVQAGLGYTITSGFPVDERYVSSIEIDNPYSRRTVYMLWPKNRELSSAAENFRLYCIDYFKNKYDMLFK